MGQLKDLDEKGFIKSVLSQYADTARVEHYDDSVIIDLERVLGIDDLPYLVYSMDHPSRIKRPLPPEMGWRFYGRWVAGCTCGDIIAMGAMPRGFSVDFATSLELEIDVLEEIYSGLGDVLDHYGATLEGGNIDVDDRLEIVGMSWGVVGRESLVRRSGARPGDLVAVTAEPGHGWASYLLARDGKFDALSEKTQDFFTRYNLLPVAPARAIVEAARIPGALTSGMDLTDGLIEFLYTILERNDLGVEIYEDHFPVTTELREAAGLLGLAPASLALEPGYDTPKIHGYTISPQHWAKVAEIFASHGAALYHVGEVRRDRDICLVRSDGRARAVPRFWDDQFSKGDLVERYWTLWRELQ